MTTDSVNTRELILEILLEVTERGQYSHLVIRSVLEKYQYLDKRERAFLTRVAEGTIQRQIELDYILDQFSKVKVRKMKPVIRAILRMGLDQLTYPKESVDAVKAWSVCYSMPEWIVAQWIGDYGKERTKEILAASLLEAPITVRTNLERITPEALAERFKEEGVTAVPLDTEKYPGLSYAYTIFGFDHLNGLSSFQEGLFYVQDISSMMVAEYAAPKEGDHCIDVCAAPGGKSIHLAEKLRGTGHVEARDVSEQKVALIDENIKRCRLTNITAKCQDATVLDEASVRTADVLIADLPCSGLGVLRRKTDIKYRMNPEGEESLVALQRQILSVVCEYVKPGGTLIYSTCTIHAAENEENARWFEQTHPEFALDTMRQMFPEEHLGDGFFIAKFKRKQDNG